MDKPICIPKEESGFKALGYENIFTAFLLLLTGSVIAAMASFCERFLTRGKPPEK